MAAPSTRPCSPGVANRTGTHVRSARCNWEPSSTTRKRLDTPRATAVGRNRRLSTAVGGSWTLMPTRFHQSSQAVSRLPPAVAHQPPLAVSIDMRQTMTQHALAYPCDTHTKAPDEPTSVPAATQPRTPRRRAAGLPFRQLMWADVRIRMVRNRPRKATLVRMLQEPGIIIMGRRSVGLVTWYHDLGWWRQSFCLPAREGRGG